MNRENKKIALIGGDMRQITAAEELKKYGYSVSMYGFDTYGDAKTKDLEITLEGAEILLLPLPVFRGEYLNMPFSHEKLTDEILISKIGEGVRLAVGGMFTAEFSEKLKQRGIALFDLCENERFNIMNSVPTAEGAAAIAMGNMKITISGCRAAVLGFGRIGKTLCRLLDGMGASVTAVSRSEKDLAQSEIFGFRSVSYATLPVIAAEQDVIFNTVPHTVVTDEILSVMKKDSFVIDLASRPGGVDCQAAARYGVRVISALSLPGKVAPVTAGKIIAECIVKNLSEAGL